MLKNNSYTRPFILGGSHEIPDSSLLSTSEAFLRTGNNTGNLAFLYAIAKHVGLKTKVVSKSEPIDAISQAGDVAIIPCANHLGPHVDFAAFAKVIEGLESSQKVVAIGLGAQGTVANQIPEVKSGTLDWLRRIAERATGGPNISVRGEFSLQVLEHYNLADNAVALGCPSLFINPDFQLGALIAKNFREPKRIAVAAGHPQWKHLSKIEASLANLVTTTKGSYIGQSPLEMVALARGDAQSLSEAKLLDCRDVICPHMDGVEFINWANSYGNVFFSATAWMEHYRKFDFVIGTRIHGVALALQAGVPALCIAHDSRTMELCEIMAIPFVLAKDVQGGVTRGMLPNLFNFDPEKFDRNRSELGVKYAQFLADNAIKTDFPFPKQLASLHQTSNVTKYDRTPGIFAEAKKIFLAKQNVSILSYGCSTGEEVFTLAEKYFPSATIMGIDISEVALKQAREQLLLKPAINDRVKFLSADEFEKNVHQSFDLIIAHSVLCRWTATMDKENIASIYPYNEFALTVKSLVSMLSKDGIISVYNSNYNPETVTESIRSFVRNLDIGFVQRFFPDGSRIPDDKLKDISVLFQKI